MPSRRVALFSDHTLGVGGGEYYTYSLLQALLARYEVDLVRPPDRPPPDRATLETGFGFDLAHPGLTLRTVDNPAAPRDHDLLINLSHFRAWPPVARQNLLVVFFPQVLNDRVHDYDAVLTISEFAANAIRRRWGSDRVVIATPSVPADRFSPGTAEPLVLSVGGGEVPDGNTKNHRDGNVRRAETLFSESVDRFPTSARSYLGLAECFYRTGQRKLMLAMVRRGGQRTIGRTRAPDQHFALSTSKSRLCRISSAHASSGGHGWKRPGRVAWHLMTTVGRPRRPCVFAVRDGCARLGSPCGAGLQACEARLKPCPTKVFTIEFRSRSGPSVRSSTRRKQGLQVR